VHNEFYFTDVLWPALRKVDFLRAIRAYQARNRALAADESRMCRAELSLWVIHVIPATSTRLVRPKPDIRPMRAFI
jgi:hypothetical protein